MKYTLTLLLLLSTLFAGKHDFSLVIDKPFNDALFDITQDYDRTISAVGFTRDYKQSEQATSQTYTNAFDYLSSLSSNSGSQIHLIKVDNAAHIKMTKTTNISDFNEAVAVVKTPQNGYFIGGHTLEGSLLVLKLDARGNIIFKKRFGTKNYDRMNNLILLSDGGVLAIGSSITTKHSNERIFETGLGLNDIFITRFTKDGTKLWSKKYGTKYDDRGIDAVEANDGSLIVISKTSYDQHQNVSLMRLSENGDRVWLKHYNTEILVTPHKIIKLRDGNFLASLSQKNEMNKDQIRLIKFDLQKNVFLDKIIHTTYSSALKDIKEFSDNKLLGVGYVKDSYNTDALAMLLDSELDLLAQEHYGGENYDLFNAVTILHNSQAAAAGVRTDENSQETNMWILKLNRDLTIAQKSTKLANLYYALQELFKEEIAAKELHIQEDLTFQFVDRALYFDAGVYKLTKKQQAFLDKFSKKLIPFLHQYKEIINTLEINGHTSSEWGGANFTTSYLENEKLSMNRSYSVLSYMFKQQNKPTKIWLAKIIKGSGFSFSQKKFKLNEQEDEKRSRRVELKILLSSNKY